MDIRDLGSARRFAAEKMVKASVFATGRLYYDLYCLEPGQAQKIHSHDHSDKVYLVLDGKASIVLGSEEADLVPSQAVLCPAGSPHGVKNTSSQRVTLLVVTTPPPDGTSLANG
jgi:mannose-6-phosphate isomerase-like protein (cupin superfamily)